MKSLRFITVAVLLAGVVLAQPKAFDVATIKPNSSADNRDSLLIQPGGRFVATGIPLKMLMTEAYNVRDFEISGGPAWINTDRWDIEARAEGVAGRLPLDQFKAMLRVLIEDRFQLKVHREMKEMPAYFLSVGKSGLKIRPNSGEPGPLIRTGRGQMTVKKVPMATVAQVLSNTLRRPVIDKTGLTGEYDFTLEWAPEAGQGTAVGGPPPGTAPDAPAAADGPTIFTAIQEQLGLRLDSQKAPVETVVVDRVERPGEN
jgi:uncharacterized protein (TIGR03435 family)